MNVIVDVEKAGLPQPFTYRVPPELPYPLALGSCLIVPFSGRRLLGYAVGSAESAPEGVELKDVLAVLDSPPAFDDTLFGLARWMADRYHCGLLDALRCFLPDGMSSHVRKLWRVRASASPEEASARQLALLQVIGQSEGGLSTDALGDTLGEPASPSVLRALVAKGMVEEVYVLEPPRLHAKLQAGIRLVRPPTEEEMERIGRRSAAQVRLLRLLQESPEPGAPRLLAPTLREAEVSPSVVASLEKRGLVESCEIAVTRDAIGPVGPPGARPALTDDQRRAFAAILQALSRAPRRPGAAASERASRDWAKNRFLLHGVTASGKTEVYLQAIQSCIDSGRQALLLVPEIALTSQALETIKGRFGTAAAVLHSKLSDGERYDEWQRIRRGDARVVVGARSAVFAPIQRLGLVILDEEHESSYKQDRPPRYHTRDVAARRAAVAGATLVYGSATPSVETYYWAQQGHLKLLEMPTRIDSRPLPTVETVDLRSETGTPAILSPRLLDALRDRLARGEQAILFLNRRGYATFVLCRDCGYAARCPNCSVTLTYHLHADLLQCHHCGHHRRAPRKCPKCSGSRIRHFGLGTERLETEVRKLVPEARPVRMDLDTTSRKGSHRRLLSALREGDANLLIGTQMVAKGLDFPRVTLVGVVAADVSLNLPDFRAAERTFQLLTQVSGRAGRGDLPGEVVVQTFQPEHYSLQAASRHDFASFYAKEIGFRRELDYPPFSRLAHLVYSCKGRQEAESRARVLAKAVTAAASAEGQKVTLLGPVPSPIERLKTLYRWRLLLKAPDMGVLNGVLHRALGSLSRGDLEGLAVDVDPSSLM